MTTTTPLGNSSKSRTYFGTQRHSEYVCVTKNLLDALTLVRFTKNMQKEDKCQQIVTRINENKNQMKKGKGQREQRLLRLQKEVDEIGKLNEPSMQQKEGEEQVKGVSRVGKEEQTREVKAGNSVEANHGDMSVQTCQ